jgi:ABC-2 type transport system permease protein
VTGRAGIVAAILAKDLRAFTRDRFYVFISLLGLVVYVSVFWLLPSTVDETVRLGVRIDEAPVLAAVIGGRVEGLDVVTFGSAADLEAAVAEHADVVAGLDFPPGFTDTVAAGGRASVRVVMTDDAPEELRPALTAMVRELAFAVAGETPPITPPDLEDAIVGTDRSGSLLSVRDRMRPLFVFFVLLIEMFALASLVASEIHQRTISAVLVTPARPSDVLAAKALLGTALAFSQAVLLMVATGSFDRAPGLLAVSLLLGAVLVTGFGLIAGSTGKDFVGIVFWSVALMLPLAVPAFGALFPGSAATWVQVLPTYGLVQVIVGATTYAEGWRDALPDLGVLVLWCAAAMGTGTLLLGRRVRRA